MVARKQKPVKWTLLAKDDLKEVLLFYKKRSPVGYLMVKEAILNTINQIKTL